MSILWKTWHSVFNALCKWTQPFPSSQAVWIITTSESSDLWRTPTFPSHIPLSTEVSLSHRSLSCPLGLFCAAWCQPSLRSPSGPLFRLATESPILLSWTSWTIFIPARLSIAFQLCWAHLSDTGSPNVLVESKLPVPHLSPPPVCIFPYSWDSAVPWEQQDCGRWGPGGWTRGS